MQFNVQSKLKKAFDILTKEGWYCRVNVPGNIEDGSAWHNVANEIGAHGPNHNVLVKKCIFINEGDFKEFLITGDTLLQHSMDCDYLRHAVKVFRSCGINVVWDEYPSTRIFIDCKPNIAEMKADQKVFESVAKDSQIKSGWLHSQWDKHIKKDNYGTDENYGAIKLTNDIQERQWDEAKRNKQVSHSDLQGMSDAQATKLAGKGDKVIEFGIKTQFDKPKASSEAKSSE